MSRLALDGPGERTPPRCELGYGRAESFTSLAPAPLAAAATVTEGTGSAPAAEATSVRTGLPLVPRLLARRSRAEIIVAAADEVEAGEGDVPAARTGHCWGPSSLQVFLTLPRRPHARPAAAVSEALAEEMSCIVGASPAALPAHCGGTPRFCWGRAAPRGGLVDPPTADAASSGRPRAGQDATGASDDEPAGAGAEAAAADAMPTPPGCGCGCCEAAPRRRKCWAAADGGDGVRDINPLGGSCGELVKPPWREGGKPCSEVPAVAAAACDGAAADAACEGGGTPPACCGGPGT